MVFVNTEYDIKKLSKDKRFTFYAGYTDKKHGFNGQEFKFDYRIKTLKAAKQFIKTILKSKRG
jgi:hypothetical protein